MNLSLTTTTAATVTAINALSTPLDPNPHPTRTIAFTTPNNYATRLTLQIQRRNWAPLWCPTVAVEATTATNSVLLRHLSHLSDYSAVAFTSRAGITAISAALSSPQPLDYFGAEFIIAALGNDAELLNREFVTRICPNPDRVKIVIPSNATPTGLVESLGPGLGRRILCPVPLVSGLEEPTVVPNFLEELANMGWVAVRVNAYETRWTGPRCAENLLKMGRVDGLVFTSTAEVEGLLKSLKEYGLGFEDLRKRWTGLIVAAHGPVTASGAESLGVKVDVVSSKFSSFEGVVQAMDHVFTSRAYPK